MPETTEQAPVEETEQIPAPIPTMILLEGTEDAPVCENGACL
ncbi:hypothetical protein [Actinoplanes derwentensis]|uniref:Uncharacterized protein n=1 Tax=Actinoplanes derwentensis TaxID=113562 RepID=A0A1H1V938_9ACTN|nr:hypothetical protein [Actinoplanes derwentensis]GID89265.1 hypothetical protein Ade03nite_81890 [Actinoplanes derwentensis]SDS81140.1 hypothetical protein SAMN04489716_1678 [Actinoplanes derwentensis]